MSRLSKRHFWNWFKRHNQEYLTLRNKSKKEATYWLNELNAHLHAYFKFFGFSLEWKEGQAATLTVTVYGKAKHFKKADDLVAKAPDITGWTIVSLEEPRPIDFLLDGQMEDTGIDPREFSFSFFNDDPDNTMLTVYHPLCTPENELLIYQLAYNAVYNLLGERSFGTDIKWFQVANLSYGDTDDLEELEALPARMGLRRSGVVVDRQGNLINTY